MRPALAIFAAVLLLAGCAGKTTSASTAAPSSSLSSVFTAPTKTFSSPALGVSFRYPASWHVTTVSVSAEDGFVGVEGPGSYAVAAGVGVTVSFQRSSKAASPLAFADVTNDEVSLARSAYAGDPLLPGIKNLNTRPLTQGGLRLVENEYLQSIGGVRWHRLMLRASQLTLASNLDIEGEYRVSRASREGPLVKAIIASMRFSRPKG